MGTSALSLYATWPGYHTVQWYQQAMGVRARWVSECPGSYPTTYYLRQDDAGNGTGGGGDGTQNSPWLFADCNDFNQLYSDNRVGGYKSFLVERGSVTYCPSIGPTITESHTHVGAWGTGNDPVWYGFAEDDGTGWTSTGTGSYYKTYTTAYWVRKQESVYTNLTIGTEVVFTKRTTQATVEANNDSWWWDSGTNRLYVRVGANLDPSTNRIDVCQTDAKGITIGDIDAVRVENQTVVGFGMGTVASQQYNIHAQVKGTNVCYIKDCKAYYSGHHVVGHLVSGGGNGGGLTLWEGCEFGLGRADGVGEATMFIAYSNDGEHEFILKDCRCRYGVLPDSGSAAWNATTIKRGSPYYAHADTVYAIGFGLVWNFTTDATTYGCKQNGRLGNNEPLTTNRGKSDEYRSWVVGDRFDGGVNTNFDFTIVDCVHMWSRYLCAVPASWGVSSPFFQTGTTALGAFVGCRILNDLTAAVAGAGTYKWLTSTTNDQRLDFIHCLLLNTNNNRSVSYDPRAVGGGNRSFGNRFFNSVWSVGTDQADSQPCMSTDGAPEGDTSDTDANITGGQRNCAFYRPGVTINKTTASGFQGYNNSPGSVDLTTLPGIDDVPANGGHLYQLGTSSNMPYALEWWMDDAGVVREFPSTPSIGALQETGLPVVPESSGGTTNRYHLFRSTLNSLSYARAS